MWIYEKKLEFPIKIKKPDARLAKIMLEQYGGPYSMRIYVHTLIPCLETFCFDPLKIKGL
ncbi:manganese catalase family protein [Anaerotignum propionicum]|jgi:spore coat protein JC|uniref:manganese catalase family protein n=1 Tax=Anaerotignum propionicum TaxID=28446 RepID=UPI002F3EBD14